MYRMSFGLLLATAVTLGGLGGGSGVLASDATEAYQSLAIIFPADPNPFYCLPLSPPAGPVDAPPWQGIVSGPIGEAALQVADAATRSQVAQTVYLLYACLAANDEARLADLVATPDLATTLAITGLNPGGGRLAAAGGSPVQLLSMRNVLIHPDGQVTWDLTVRGNDRTVTEVNGAVQFIGGRYRLVAFGPGPGKLPEAPLAVVAAPGCDGGAFYLAGIGPGLTRDRPIVDPIVTIPGAGVWADLDPSAVPPIAPELLGCGDNAPGWI